MYVQFTKEGISLLESLTHNLLKNKELWLKSLN